MSSHGTTWQAPCCATCGRKLQRAPKTTPALREQIRERWFSRKNTQLELAMEYDLSQSSIARICAGIQAREL